MGLKDGEAVSILNDNAGAIALSKNPVHHNRSKHIALRHHFLREQVTEGMVDLAHVPSVDNLADLLTKPLPRDTFDRLRGRIGLSPRMTRSLRSEDLPFPWMQAGPWNPYMSLAHAPNPPCCPTDLPILTVPWLEHLNVLFCGASHGGWC